MNDVETYIYLANITKQNITTITQDYCQNLYYYLQQNYVCIQESKKYLTWDQAIVIVIVTLAIGIYLGVRMRGEEHHE